jgi:hypothetical protein
MSALRSLRRNITETLIGIRCNRFDTNKRKPNSSFKASHESLKAAVAAIDAKADPLRHRTFARHVQASINFDRGGISLKQANEEGQI